MRVVEPRQFRHISKKHRSRKKLWFMVFGIAVIVPGLAYIAFERDVFSRGDVPKATQVKITSSDAKNDQASSVEVQKPATGKFKEFSGEEFKQLYQSTAYPNVQPVDSSLKISGNAAADARIRGLAEARGYRQTSVPQGSIVKIDEPQLNGDDLLQPLAAVSWQSLKDAALKDGYPLSIISAYRSPEYQRNLFMERLAGNGTTPKLIADGIGDLVVERTLEMTAVPGYSRHHTGYTVDLWCEDGSGSFRVSKCYSWLSQNNYLHAKEHGWIPSYPEGTDLQGPEPEPWEYVWVGTDVLREVQ